MNPAPVARSWRLLVLAATFLYTAGFLLWYARTPLGRIPLLDGFEVVRLAQDIADGTLPHEPFYRAPLYSALLALSLKAGIAPVWLPDVARLLNGICHLATTSLVFSISLRLWRRESAAGLSALLYGLYPVALHFAGDAGDTSLGIALFLGGVNAALAAHDDAQASRTLRWSALSTALLALATLARPQYLPVLLAWLIYLAVGALRRRVALGTLATSVGCAALLLGAMGVVNQRLSGDFVVLPWQGAYNLWAANGPNANGRYFEQSAVVAYDGPYMNPTRLESEALYLKETGVSAPANYADASRYWRSRTIGYVIEHPHTWLALMGGKLLYLADNVEQYNNKTYALHKSLSPWLAPNPLCWSLLLTLALLALLLAPRSVQLDLLLGAMAVYLAGVLAFYVSDRFRLPAAPLLAVCAGGLAALPVAELRRRMSDRAPWAFGALVLGALSLAPIPEVNSRPTEPEDFALLAKAATDLGRHEEALKYATMSLQRYPDEGKMTFVACLSRYNIWLAGLPEQEASAESLRESLSYCARVEHSRDLAAFIAGVLSYKLGDTDAALARWRGMLDRRSPESMNAAAGMLMADQIPIGAMEGVPREQVPLILAAALASKGSAAWREYMIGARGEAWTTREIARVKAQFEPRHN